MLRLELAIGVAVFLVSVFTLVQIASTPGGEVRALPRLGWMLVVLLFPGLGVLGYLALGRPLAERLRQPRPPETTTPESDEEFRRRVRERAEEQRRRAREQGPEEEGQ